MSMTMTMTAGAFRAAHDAPMWVADGAGITSGTSAWGALAYAAKQRFAATGNAVDTTPGPRLEATGLI